MLPLFGLLIVFGCVIGGYFAMGGKMVVLLQPWELVIIAGASIGAFIVSNKGAIIRDTFKDLIYAFREPRYTKKQFIELLTLLYQVLKIARAKGIMSLEEHIENPSKSPFFGQYKDFAKNKIAVTFLCDYLRMILMTHDQTQRVISAMDEEIHAYRKDRGEVVTAMNNLGDSLPAIGIVAAVLGVIRAMGSITEPPSVLGKMMASALMGTFLGVFLCS